MLVVFAVVGAPVHRAVLEGRGAENQGRQPDRPLCLEGDVREKAVIAEGDAQAGCDEEEQEHRHLKGIDAVKPQVEWHGGAGHDERSDQERAVGPINA
jgi:hypothetical protein